MIDNENVAPGAPGIPARWTSSAKSGVGTAPTASSRVWFTLSHGILNEVYYPRLDSACTRDLGLIVTGDGAYFSEEKRHASHAVEWLEDGVPAFRLTNTALDGVYRIDKRIVADPLRPTVLQEIEFTPLKGAIEDYHVHALLAPHLVNAGMGNTAWIGDYKGVTMLFASGRDRSLAMACSLPWVAASAGYVGVSDGWQQLARSGKLNPQYQIASNGNVALTGEIGFSRDSNKAVVALAFGPGPEEAGYNALASLMAGFDDTAKAYIAGWRDWQKNVLPLERTGWTGQNLYRTSTAVLATHRALSFPGPAVASLSIPWGFDKGDDDLGGYHLVWPRDLVETAGGFLAAGMSEDAMHILSYLRTIQEADGHWPQNAWLDGVTYWDGIQMDECGFPLLLVDGLRRYGSLKGEALASYLPMVERATSYLVRNGPVTGEDRWEEDAGFSPFTLAVEIAALLAAADILDECGNSDAALYARETADSWNDQVEKWTYVTDTPQCEAFGVKGYYVRITPAEIADAASPKDGFVPIKNRPPGDTDRPLDLIISPDALALVRFGLRAADDPRIIDTVTMIDANLRAELPQGPVWYRYTDDGYGEHPNGAPFDGTGQGRPWPLLVGERAHYEIAAGRTSIAEDLLATFSALAGPGGLLPEQVWDGADMPERELMRGGPTGSAMPLVWAHSEFIKLLRSLRDGRVFDMPPQGPERYIRNKSPSPHRIWRFNNKISVMPPGKILRLELLASATVRWSADRWETTRDSLTSKNTFGVHLVDLPTSALAIGDIITFTLCWADGYAWEGTDFTLVIASD